MGLIKTEYGFCYSSDTMFNDYRDMDDCGYYIGDTGKLYASQSKKLKNIYHLIYESENLVRAQYNAQKGKGDRTEIRKFNDNIIERLTLLYEQLRHMTYKPGEYKTKTIYEPKERVIMIAPFFPDRIVHHCVINVLGQHWTHIFTSNTYACIKGRGVHKCMEDLHRDMMMDKKGTKYCLKIDVRKYFDNVDHASMKRIIRYTIADDQMLWLLDSIIDSNGKTIGLPIGNYTSQYLANLYLAYFDHWVKEDLAKMVMAKYGVKIYYYRYMDDIVVLCSNKEALHFILDMMGLYLATELKLEIKPNWQIFPVDDRCIDYVGFKQNHYGILLRKGILMRFYKKLNKVKKRYEIKDINDVKHLFPSEYGWVIRCSEEHSKFIFNKCLNNGNNNISYRFAG